MDFSLLLPFVRSLHACSEPLVRPVFSTLLTLSAVTIPLDSIQFVVQNNQFNCYHEYLRRTEKEEKKKMHTLNWTEMKEKKEKKRNQMLSIVNKRDSFVVVVVISSTRLPFTIQPIEWRVDGTATGILCRRSRYTITSEYLFEVSSAHFLSLILIDTINCFSVLKGNFSYIVINWKCHWR